MRTEDQAMSSSGPEPPSCSETLAFSDLLEVSDLLLASGKVRLRIASRSMVPTLWPGDEIIVEPASLDGLRPGNLILFQHQRQLICHRLIEISGASPTLLTRGNAESCVGERIDYEQLVGKVVAIRKRSQWLGLKDTLQRAFLPSLLRWLPCLQRRKAYRLLLRPLVVPFCSFHLGLAQGSRWYQWQELRTVDGVPALPPSARPHLLVAKRGTSAVGSIALTWRNARWQCGEVAVRIRYRGLGIEADLVRVAQVLCNGGGVIRWN